MTERKFSSSEERSFKTCRLAHHFEYDLGFRRVIPNRKLSVGIIAHRGMEAFYQGEDFMAATEAAADEYWQQIITDGGAGMPGYADALTAFQSDKDLVLAMVKGYADWVQRTGADDHYEIVDVEQSYFIEIPGLPAGVPVRMDLVQRDKRDGSLRIVDFKTARSIPNDFTAYQLSEQNGNYQLAALAIYDERPTELAYRFLRKALPDTRPQNDEGLYLNKDGSVSKRQPAARFHEEPILLTKQELQYRLAEIRRVQGERFDPDRKIYSQPDNCCGTWKNDWRKPCMLVHQGYTPEEALEASPGYEKEDAYERYDDLEEDNG